MTNSKHLVELNGKLYDAVTGQPVTTPVAATKPVNHVQLASKTVKTIDIGGASRQPKAHPAANHQSAHRQSRQPAVTGPKPTRKPLQKSKTLMRSAVHKPHNHLRNKPTVVAGVKPEPSVTGRSLQVPAHRLSRATKVPRSAVISKFGSTIGSQVAVSITPVPVQEEPSSEVMPVLDHRLKPVKAVKPGTGRQSPVIQATSGHTSPAAANRHYNFERALSQATSHELPRLPHPAKTRRVKQRLNTSSRLTRFSAAAAAAIILGGFYFVNNLSVLSVRLAAARANVPASLPAYQPAGFSLSRTVEYAPGQISLHFQSNSDRRYYSLTQQATAKDSQTLLKERADNQQAPFYTLEHDGKLVFVYDDNRAAWLENGQWFELRDNADLSSDQLLKVISSI